MVDFNLRRAIQDVDDDAAQRVLLWAAEAIERLGKVVNQLVERERSDQITRTDDKEHHQRVCIYCKQGTYVEVPVPGGGLPALEASSAEVWVAMRCPVCGNVQLFHEAESAESEGDHVG